MISPPTLRANDRRQDRMPRRCVALVAVFCAAGQASGCALPATVRTGEITRSGLAAEAALPIVAYEPQTSVDRDGAAGKSKTSFSPLPSWSVRGRLSRCELGGSLMLRDVAEVRCGLWQESEGAPISIAPSVAGGYVIYPKGPWVRAGIDVSRRFGVVSPMVNAYISYGPELHWMQRTSPRDDDPREGPFPASVSSERRELRLSIPFGLAFRIVDGDVHLTPGWNDDFTKEEIEESHDLTWSLVFGGTAWWVLRSTIREQQALSYDADRGLAFTIGFEIR
jgi:hypothetical protein